MVHNTARCGHDNVSEKRVVKLVYMEKFSHTRDKLIGVRCRGNLCSKIRAEELQFGNIFSSTILEDGNN